MKSKWFHLKEMVSNERRMGMSLRDASKKYGIPSSTLSGWFKNVSIEEKHKTKLRNNWIKGLIKARNKAVVSNNLQKQKRLMLAEKEALFALAGIDTSQKYIIELALALLYLGEGFKTQNGTGMGSSDPLILRFFVFALIEIYKVEIASIKCSLHLRADQDPDKMQYYWANELNLPLSNFTKSSVDLRTKGRPTYPTYNGVCVVQCGNISIQRKLVYLSRIFCERAVSSAGRAPT